MRNCPACNALLRGQELCTYEEKARQTAALDAIAAGGKAMCS
jgi:hypothetical protein